jgi:regulator of sigma E protease
MPVADVFVDQVQPNTPAAAAGIQPGDRIVRIDGRDVRSPGDVFYLMTLNLGATTDVTVERGGQRITADIRPRWDPPPDQGATGIVINYRNIRTESTSVPIWTAPWHGLQKTWEILVIAKNEITRWVIGASAPQVAGPIGIAQMTGEVAGLGIAPLLEFVALLSLNLGIMNLLPLPMLDGGRLAFLGVEALRGGKRVSPRVEGAIHFVGFVTLMGLIILISYFDILRLVTGQPVVP